MKKFIKTIENFTCEHCGTRVEGDGYTNHCPECLWGKHVDVNPGDRSAQCGGLMEPIGLQLEGTKQLITHRCVLCGFARRNSVSELDNQEQIIKLSTKHARLS